MLLENSPKSYENWRKPRRHDSPLHDRHDRNRDGALSLEEIFAGGDATRAQKLRKRFRQADRNRDGVVTRAEFKQTIRNHH